MTFNVNAALHLKKQNYFLMSQQYKGFHSLGIKYIFQSFFSLKTLGHLKIIQINLIKS